jgi:hypothetical protein
MINTLSSAFGESCVVEVSASPGTLKMSAALYMWAAALEASATDQEIGIGSEFRVLLGRTVRSNQFSPRTLPALCTILSNFPEPKG